MHPDFNPPTASKITGRKSTITGLFLTAITPCITPTDDEIREALTVLGMTEGACCCAYCGGLKTEWDHLNAIVRDRQPTGYITEIANLVPSCGKCNQSKGNKPWRSWIKSNARHSPANRKITDLHQRIARLEAYEQWRKPITIDYKATVGVENWSKHMEHLNKMVTLLEEAETHANICRQIITKSNSAVEKAATIDTNPIRWKEIKPC